LDTATVVYHNPKKVLMYSEAERAEKLSLFPLSSSLICGTTQSKQYEGVSYYRNKGGYPHMGNIYPNSSWRGK
jgi:hypothetical protein